MAVRLLANQNLSENEVLALRSEPVVDSNGELNARVSSVRDKTRSDVDFCVFK